MQRYVHRFSAEVARITATRSLAGFESATQLHDRVQQLSISNAGLTAHAAKYNAWKVH